jgi:hypothetical protein
LRNIAQGKIKHLMRNGSSITLWYDNRCPIDPLAIQFGNRMIHDSALGDNATIGYTISGSDWKWPTNKSGDCLELEGAPLTDFRPNMVSDDCRNSKFSANSY